MKTAERPISSRSLRVGEYPIMEHFYTLQGEAAFSGVAAYFIRLGGCDVGCHWCDVKESWDADAHPLMLASELAEIAAASGTQRVIITGGEPTLFDLAPLVDALHVKGLLVHIETSGTNPLTGAFDWVCFSPKKFKAPLDEYYSRCHELKVIVHNRHDLKWAEGHAQKLAEAGNTTAVRYLQPEWDTPDSVAWCIEYIKANPLWRLSLQTHKYLNIP